MKRPNRTIKRNPLDESFNKDHSNKLPTLRKGTTSAKRNKNLRRVRKTRWPSLSKICPTTSNKYSPLKEDIKHGLRKE